MQKVLIITYYWPPAGGPGVQRWLKMSKYLPDNNVQPIVVTVDPEYASYPITDDSLLKDIPSDIRIERTKSFEILNLYSSLTKKQAPTSGFANEEGKLGVKDKVFRFIRGNVFLPDARKGWNRYAYERCVNIIKHEEITGIITTGPPHSTHLIGKKLKSSFPNLIWLADFRDPWTDIFYNESLHQTALARKVELHMEKSVLKSADHVTVMGMRTAKSFALRAGKEDNIHFLPNGFDPADFPTNHIETKEDVFRILYVGTATKDYPVAAFFSAMSKLPDPLREKLKIEFVGKVDTAIRNMATKFAAQLDIVFTQYIPHAEVPQKLFSSDVLLLLIPGQLNNEAIIPGKLFEYMASKRPVMGIGPENGDSAQLITEAGVGGMFSPENHKGMIDFAHSVATHQYEYKGRIAPFSREKQAAFVANFFSKV